MRPIRAADPAAEGTAAGTGVPWWRADRWALVTAAVIAVLCWPVGLAQVGRGLDASYATNLHLLAGSGQVFGRDIVFLYGPLGYLAFPTFVAGTTAVLAVLANVGVVGALAYRLLVTLSRRCPRWVAGVSVAAFVLVGLRPLAIPVVGASLLPEAAILLVAVWTVDLVSRPAATPVPVVGVVAMTTFVTAFSMVKAQLAVLGFVMVAVGIVVRAWPHGRARQVVHDVGIMAATALVALVGLWLVAGQPLGALPDYVRGSIEVVSGYSDAMNRHSRDGDAWIALVVAVVLLALVATARGCSRRRRLVVGATVAGLLLLGWKEGFVRSDALHTPRYFLLAGATALGCVTVLGARRAIALGLACTAVAAWILGVSVADVVDVPDRLVGVGQTARFAVSPGSRDATIRAARQGLRDSYHLDPAIVARIRGTTVEVQPWETGIQFAYPEATWDPAPMFHRVNAYTERLDRMNAAALSGRGRPDHVLRQPGVTVDGRLPRFDAPGANWAVACHYRRVHADPEWDLLARTADRCGPARVGPTRTVRLGQEVRVPTAPPGQAVTATFSGLGTSPTDRLRSLVSAGPEFEIATRSPEGISGEHRFLPGTQGDPHVLRTPACFAPEVEGPDVAAFRITSGSSTREYRVTFAFVPVTC